MQYQSKRLTLHRSRYCTPARCSTAPFNEQHQHHVTARTLNAAPFNEQHQHHVTARTLHAALGASGLTFSREHVGRVVWNRTVVCTQHVILQLNDSDLHVLDELWVQLAARTGEHYRCAMCNTSVQCAIQVCKREDRHICTQGHSLACCWHACGYKSTDLLTTNMHAPLPHIKKRKV